MAEVIVSSDGEEVKREGNSSNVKRVKKSDGMVKWERFLPKMILRVLLVEADDCTRQIIAALLRKCSYKVVTVSDGLKAWEAIRARPNDIDLILTEVDLPSISGFALLTLVMEHKACRNIPVIMMSSHDSVNMVYKCMLRGAVDFLTKPIRKNELKNLWQHVWRRQSVNVVNSGVHDESVAQRRVEASSKNNATSNNSSGSMDCSLTKNKRQLDKGNDSQSSCTKPDMEAESNYMEKVHDPSHSKRIKSSTTNKSSQNEEEQTLAIHESGLDESMKSGSETSKVGDLKNQNEEMAQSNNEDNVVRVSVNSSREVIDLIGTFDNHGKCDNGNLCLTDGFNKMDSSPELDLSLKRYQSNTNENQPIVEKQTMNHSNSSPFSRYQTLHPFHSTPTSISNQQEEYGSGSNTLFSSLLPSYNSDSSCPTHLTQKSVLSYAANQSEHTESLKCHQPGLFPVPVQVQGISYDSSCAGYGALLSQIFTAQSANQTETMFQVNPFHNQFDQNARDFTNQATNASLDDETDVSPTTNRSPNSSFGNGGSERLQTRDENLQTRDENLQTRDESSRRFNLREAALIKFRLKRKERCYEKKVRYESRKKLAEQRPRVKGQFVRQVQ